MWEDAYDDYIDAHDIDDAHAMNMNEFLKSLETSNAIHVRIDRINNRVYTWWGGRDIGVFTLQGQDVDRFEVGPIADLAEVDRRIDDDMEKSDRKNY